MVFHRGHTLSPYYLAFWNLVLWFYWIFTCFYLILFYFIFFLLFSFNYFYLLFIFIRLYFIFILFCLIIFYLLFYFYFVVFSFIICSYFCLIFRHHYFSRGLDIGELAVRVPFQLFWRWIMCIYIFLGLRVLICGLRVDVFWCLARADECCALYISNRLHRL